MLSSHLILCRPLLLLHSIFPRIRVFSKESALCIRWPKYWNFSFSISPSSEYSGLISFRIADWLAGSPHSPRDLQESSPTPIVQKHQLFGAQLSLYSSCPGGSVVKNLLQAGDAQGMQVRSLGQEDPLEKEMATHSIILAWEIPWTEERGGLQIVGLQRSQTQLTNLATTNDPIQGWSCGPCHPDIFFFDLRIILRNNRRKEALKIGKSSFCKGNLHLLWKSLSVRVSPTLSQKRKMTHEKLSVEKARPKCT